jgi:catechol 2,3-dioxygenase-like lactoylglutathione lyase family enzyme
VGGADGGLSDRSHVHVEADESPGTGRTAEREDGSSQWRLDETPCWPWRFAVAGSSCGPLAYHYRNVLLSVARSRAGASGVTEHAHDQEPRERVSERCRGLGRVLVKFGDGAR